MLMARDFHCGLKIAVYVRTVYFRRVVEPEGVIKFPPALSRKASGHAATSSHFRHIEPSSGWVEVTGQKVGLSLWAANFDVKAVGNFLYRCTILTVRKKFPSIDASGLASQHRPAVTGARVVDAPRLKLCDNPSLLRSAAWPRSAGWLRPATIPR